MRICWTVIGWFWRVGGVIINWPVIGLGETQVCVTSSHWWHQWNYPLWPWHWMCRVFVRCCKQVKMTWHLAPSIPVVSPRRWEATGQVITYNRPRVVRTSQSSPRATSQVSSRSWVACAPLVANSIKKTTWAAHICVGWHLPDPCHMRTPGSGPHLPQSPLIVYPRIPGKTPRVLYKPFVFPS